MRKSTSQPSTSQQAGKHAADDFGGKPFEQQAYVSEADAPGAPASGSLTPEADLPRWATRAPEGEKLESTQYADRVQHDLSFVKGAPGVPKPDPILVADNITRKFGGVTAVDVQHFEIERHGITALMALNLLDAYSFSPEDFGKPETVHLQMEAILRSNLSFYDYAAAGETAKALPPHKFNAVKDLISMAQNRYLLNYSEVDRLIRTTGYDCIPIKSGSIRPVFEYALGVEIRLKREEYADYVRSWSPLIYSLMKAYVKKLGINIDDFTYINSNGVRCISESKLNRKPDLYRVLTGSYNSSGQPSFLSSRHMVLIIQVFGKSPDEISIFEKLRIAEESIRNKAAHEVIAITARDILSATGLTAGQIMNLFKKAIRLIDDHANEEAWKSYDCLNEYIIQALQQG